MNTTSTGQVKQQRSRWECLKRGVAMCTMVAGLSSLAGCSGGSDGGAAPTSSAPNSSANLSSLALSAGTLNPPFEPDATAYNTMFIGDTTVTVTPTAADSRSTITVNGTPVVSGQVSPSITLPAGTTTVTVQVRAADGVTTKAYSIAAHRLAQEAYVKASNTQVNTDEFSGDHFSSVAISGDTLVVGALGEDSADSGNQLDNSAVDSGAVYVFVRTGVTWSQQAYIKAVNDFTDNNSGDGFGSSVAIWEDTLLVGAPGEDSNARGVNGDWSNNNSLDAGAVYVFVRAGGVWRFQAYIKASNTPVVNAFIRFGTSVAVSGDTAVVGAPNEGGSGAVYVFTRTGSNWSQQAYLKASNAESATSRFDTADSFGSSVALSGDTLAVGALGEDSNAIGVNGNQADNSALNSGAAYVFTRTNGVWSQQAYLKASNAGTEDRFGSSVALSSDTLAVGANQESSNATGVNGNQADNSAGASGAVYVFTRTNTLWSQQAYVKASNTGPGDQFGQVALSGDTLVVGAWRESSAATGVNGDQFNESASLSGAVYLFARTSGVWAQQAYLKPSSPQITNIVSQLRFGSFGASVAVSGDSVAVGAWRENSAATGINGNQFDSSALNAGAVYVFR